MEVTRDQARAFLRTLWPEGQMAFLANHTRTHIEARIGHVPHEIPYSHDHADMHQLRQLAELLRGVAHHIALADETVKSQTNN